MDCGLTPQYMAEVRLTLEEYEALRRLISSERESEGAVEEEKRRNSRKTQSFKIPERIRATDEEAQSTSSAH